jgi:hypothetical protein
VLYFFHYSISLICLVQICAKNDVMCKNYPILSYISNLGKNNIVLDMFDICSYCKSGQYMKVICMDCSCICYIQLWTNTTKLWAYIVQYFLIFQICQKNMTVMCKKNLNYLIYSNLGKHRTHDRAHQRENGGTRIL